MDKDGCNHSLGLIDKMKAGEPLLESALEALRRYHNVQGTKPSEEVERLRVDAEALFTAVNEYQRQALGGPAPQLH